LVLDNFSVSKNKSVEAKLCVPLNLSVSVRDPLCANGFVLSKVLLGVIFFVADHSRVFEKGLFVSVNDSVREK
jgi:hypothetical protein